MSPRIDLQLFLCATERQGGCEENSHFAVGSATSARVVGLLLRVSTSRYSVDRTLVVTSRIFHLVRHDLVAGLAVKTGPRSF
jgi:hypothetical protein